MCHFSLFGKWKGEQTLQLLGRPRRQTTLIIWYRHSYTQTNTQKPTHRHIHMLRTKRTKPNRLQISDQNSDCYKIPTTKYTAPNTRDVKYQIVRIVMWTVVITAVMPAQSLTHVSYERVSEATSEALLANGHSIKNVLQWNTINIHLCRMHICIRIRIRICYTWLSISGCINWMIAN